MANFIIKGAKATVSAMSDDERRAHEQAELRGMAAPIVNSLQGIGQGLGAQAPTDAAGVERLLRAAESNRIRAGEIAGATELQKIQWPAIEHYGYDHGKQVSQLSVHIIQSLFTDETKAQQERMIGIVKSAGLLHDLGRTEPWDRPNPNHQMRSAELAAKTLKEDTTFWAQREFHDDICRLIANHRLPPLGIPAAEAVEQCPRDPLGQALFEAECLDGCRFAVGTLEGLKIMKQRFALLRSPWATLEKEGERVHQNRWREYRGWVRG